MSGLAKVSRRGRKVGELGPGDFFGELALLIDSNRNATVTALTPMEAIVLSRREFEAALADAPRMTRKIMAGMARRLAECAENNSKPREAAASTTEPTLP